MRASSPPSISRDLFVLPDSWTRGTQGSCRPSCWLSGLPWLRAVNRLSLLDLPAPYSSPPPTSDHNGPRLIQCPGIEAIDQCPQWQAAGGGGAAPCPSPGLGEFQRLEGGWVS